MPPPLVSGFLRARFCRGRTPTPFYLGRLHAFTVLQTMGVFTPPFRGISAGRCPTAPHAFYARATCLPGGFSTVLPHCSHHYAGAFPFGPLRLRYTARYLYVCAHTTTTVPDHCVWTAHRCLFFPVLYACACRTPPAHAPHRTGHPPFTVRCRSRFAHLDWFYAYVWVLPPQFLLVYRFRRHALPGSASRLTYTCTRLHRQPFPPLAFCGLRVLRNGFLSGFRSRTRIPLDCAHTLPRHHYHLYGLFHTPAYAHAFSDYLTFGSPHIAFSFWVWLGSRLVLHTLHFTHRA